MPAMTKDTARQFRADFTAAMAALEAKYGVAISMGTMSLYPDKTTARLQVTPKEVLQAKASAAEAVAAAGGIPADVPADWINAGHRHIPDWMGKTFIHGTKTYTICGFAARSDKYQIAAHDARGRISRFSKVYIQVLLAAAH